MAELIRRVDAASLGMFDGVVVFWLVLWSAVGGWVGFSLWELSDLGGTIVQSGRTLDSAGRTLQDAGNLPLIGEWPQRLGDEVRATAADIVSRGRETAAYGRQLAVLLGLTVALAPVVPVLAPYLPARAGRRREVDTIARLLHDPAHRRTVDFYLAHRALTLLPLHRLCHATDDPWRDLAEGRLRPLADAELSRLGLSRADADVRQ
jgi:hypothetical protein